MSEDAGIGEVRDGYHGQLLGVTEACHADGLVFAEQMATLCRAFRSMRAQMTGDRVEMMLIEPPGASLARTPAGRILEMTMAYRTEDIKPGQTIRAKRMGEPAAEQASAGGTRDRGSFVIESGPLPEPPKGVRLRKGPSSRDLLELPADQFIRIKPGEVKISTLRVRLAHVRKKTREQGRELRLVCWEDADGTIIVRHA